MPISIIDNLVKDWTFNNTLTINDDVTIAGDLITTGFIFCDSIVVGFLGTNNVWTGTNNYPNFMPTYITPTANDHLATEAYLSSVVVGSTDALLTSNNTWLGAENLFITMPQVTSDSGLGVNGWVRKSQADALIAGGAVDLESTNNVWSGTNNFYNHFVQVTCPTPTIPSHFANKTYVDTAVSTFNSTGGNLDYLEWLVPTAGGLPVAFNLSSAIYSSALVVMCSGGGGQLAPVIDGSNTKSFGGSGCMIAFRIPAGTGVYEYQATPSSVYPNPVVTGYQKLIIDGTDVCQNFDGLKAPTSGPGGSGGVCTFAAGITNAQIITGFTKGIQNPTDATINRNFNYACMNGYGQGGSFTYDTGVLVNPTGQYCFIIKFKR